MRMKKVSFFALKVLENSSLLELPGRFKVIAENEEVNETNKDTPQSLSLNLTDRFPASFFATKAS